MATKKMSMPALLGSVVRVFTKVDSAIAGHPVTVALDLYGNRHTTPAYSQGSEIFLNPSALTEGDIAEMIQLQGLNYHELAHVLYTPPLPMFQRQYTASYNILEDQRIESMMVLALPNTAKYLSATVSRWILSLDMGSSFPLIWGRHFIPEEIRTKARALFKEQDKVDMICEIINEYRTLTFPRDWDRGMELVIEFDALLPNDASSSCAYTGHSHRAQQVENKVGEEPEAQEGDAQPQRDSDRDQGSGTDGDSAEQNGSPPQDASDSGDQPPSHGTGGASSSDLKDALRSHMAALEADPELQSDARKIRDWARDGNRHYVEGTTTAQFSTTPPTSELRRSARKFEEELRALSQSSEAGWDRRTSSGRLNVDRYIGGADVDECFDRWDEGTDGYDLEVVTLGDVSISMAPRPWTTPPTNFPKALSESMWLIDSAVKEIEGGHRAYAFNSSHRLIYAAVDKPGKLVKELWASGGTNPLEVLEVAEATLATSKRANKLLILLTDGDWEDSEECDNVIERMRYRGVTVAIAFMNTVGAHTSPEELERLYRHGADIFAEISSPHDMPKWMRDVVRHVTKSRGPR